MRDPQNDESSDYCRKHKRDFWPSEGCPECWEDFFRERPEIASD